MRARHWAAAAGAVALCGSSAADPPLASTTITAQDPASGGEVRVVSSVYRDSPTHRWDLRYEYELTNLSYDPAPGVTNAMSGLSISWGILPGPTSAGNPVAPSGWTIDFRLSGGTYFADFVRPWSDGLGIEIGQSATFGFTTHGFGYTSQDDTFGDTAFTHTVSGPEGWFWLRDATTHVGLVQPAPAPGVLGLAAVGGLTLARRRRSKGSLCNA